MVGDEIEGEGFWDTWELERRTVQKENRRESGKEKEQEAGRAGGREIRGSGLHDTPLPLSLATVSTLWMKLYLMQFFQSQTLIL